MLIIEMQLFSADGLQQDSAWWEFVPGALTAIEMDSKMMISKF